MNTRCRIGELVDSCVIAYLESLTFCEDSLCSALLATLGGTVRDFGGKEELHASFLDRSRSSLA
jgi:hypothetical protein